MFTEKQKSQFVNGIGLFLLVISVFFVVKIINEIRAGQYIGSKDTPSTISVSGDGEFFAAPDIAMISFTARGEGSTTKIAQTKETEMINKAVKYLKDKGIAEKDIKTSTYYAQPKYEYAPCTKLYCPTSQSRIVGYEASQTVDIKIRDIDTIGDVLTGLGENGIAEISGPNFTIEDEDKIKDDARALAITEAKTKAEKLASDLGVHIVRVISFNESNGGYPMYYAKDAMMSAGAESAPSASPAVPTGENKISVNVTITYEIR
ncbi:MAG: hypothetical protein RL641_149 [Candidatus Parcubacteria bacterium]|jgi:uncharacterized protein YggE